MAGGLGNAKGKLANVLPRGQVIEYYQGREEVFSLVEVVAGVWGVFLSLHETESWQGQVLLDLSEYPNR